MHAFYMHSDPQKMAIPKIKAFLTHGFMSNETFVINCLNKCE